MPFLENSWYCAGWSAELDQGPVGRRILGEYLVLFRSEAGVALAMTGRCPHRFAPLDLGVIAGDTISCPYHGLRFAISGECVLNPHGGPIPPQARLRTYPLLERNGALWIWMGDPALADRSLLPDDDWLDAPSHSARTTYLKVQAHYQLVTDNLLDLTHTQYLHRSTLAGSPGEMGALEHEHSLVNGVVHSDYRFPHAIRPPNFETIFPHAYGELTAKMEWRPASTLSLEVRMRGADADVHLMAAHYLTPETDATTHYFAAVGRNVNLDDRAEDERMLASVEKAFALEDEPMIRACHQLMGTSDLLALKPAILATDAPGILARRTLAKRIKEAVTRAVADDNLEFAT